MMVEMFEKVSASAGGQNNPYSSDVLIKNFNATQIGGVDGGWGNWSDWVCSAGCGGGNIIRFRLCNSPEPKYGGEPCVGNDTLSKNTTEVCNNQTCDGKHIEINNWILTFLKFSELLVGPTQFSALQENRTFKTFEKWGPHFEISLEIFINSLSGIAVMRFTNTLSSFTSPGARIPEVFLHVGMDFGFGFRISESGPNIDLSNDVNINEWFNISIHQYPENNVRKII